MQRLQVVRLLHVRAHGCGFRRGQGRAGLFRCCGQRSSGRGRGGCCVGSRRRAAACVTTAAAARQDGGNDGVVLQGGQLGFQA
jgi:hypothetical protein